MSIYKDINFRVKLVPTSIQMVGDELDQGQGQLHMFARGRKDDGTYTAETSQRSVSIEDLIGRTFNCGIRGDHIMAAFIELFEDEFGDKEAV